MSDATVPDEFNTIATKFVILAGNEHNEIDPGDPVDHWNRPRRDARPVPILAWMGPTYFARTYGATPTDDQGFGTTWGPNGDQRVRLHIEVGADVGLLHVYDPTRDEYPLLGTHIPLAVANEFAYLRDSAPNALTPRTSPRCEP